MMVIDDKAEALENAGLYRRAAARWLEVFDRRVSEKERDWIRQRRNECLRKRVKPPVRVDNFSDVRRAADATQKKMGIARPGGDAFRLKDKRWG
ncbi:PerC family transcriptional regulator [Rahnella contaminans]|uniref:PerC family transcriptional regulator n=1 Tax=Rahnella contaminans TaxID=2703882 RepID=UPI0023DC73A4|nr:PerC family transcriptional regulator [Rahnella contaminans]MDF1896748.1 PerC family transcriptional regulator [Rahnella contaminans]